MESDMGNVSQTWPRGHEWPTIADYMKFENEPMIDLFEATRQQYPVVQEFKVLSTNLISGDYPYVTSIPMAKVRDENKGLPNRKASIGLSYCTKQFTDASWAQDQKVAMSNPMGIAYANYIQAEASFVGLMQTQEAFMINGNNDIGGILEFLDGRTVDLTDSYDGFIKMATDAGKVFDIDDKPKKSAGSVKYTAILVNRKTVRLLAQFGGMKVGEVREIRLTDEDGDGYWGYAQNIVAYFGLLNGNKRGVGVIKAFHLTDELISKTISRNFQIGEDPDLIIVSREGRQSIRSSRKSYNDNGIPPAQVEYIDDAKVVVSGFVKDELYETE